MDFYVISLGMQYSIITEGFSNEMFKNSRVLILKQHKTLPQLQNLPHIIWMSLLQEETEEVFETSQKVDPLSEVVVADPQDECLSVTVNTEHILQHTRTYKKHIIFSLHSTCNPTHCRHLKGYSSQ